MCLSTVQLKFWYSTGRLWCRDQRVRRLSPELWQKVASRRQKNDLQVAMFFSYTSVFNSVLHVMTCKTLTPQLQVLVADYDVECATNEHRTAQWVAVCLTLILFLVPVVALWRALPLPMRDRLLHPCVHNQGLKPWEEHLRLLFVEEAQAQTYQEQPAAAVIGAPVTANDDDETMLQRVSSRGMPENKDQEIARLRQERDILSGDNTPRHAAQKIQDVETLVNLFTHADVLKLMSAEPVSKGFKPPRAFWRRCCSE